MKTATNRMIELGKVRDNVFSFNQAAEDSGVSRNRSEIVAAGVAAVRAGKDSLTFVNKSKRRDK